MHGTLYKELIVCCSFRVIYFIFFSKDSELYLVNQNNTVYLCYNEKQFKHRNYTS